MWQFGGRPGNRAWTFTLWRKSYYRQPGSAETVHKHMILCLNTKGFPGHPSYPIKSLSVFADLVTSDRIFAIFLENTLSK